MNFLSKNELTEKYGKIPWISPYRKLVAVTDGEFIELHEYHARGKCIGGSAWEIYHYPRVSDLIISARREGARNIFVLKKGETELRLIPGIAGAGIESAIIKDSSIEITYSGLAGGGIAATVCRGLAEGVDGIEIINLGGGAELGRAKIRLKPYRKVVIGIDDTDSREGGATWALANEIAHALEQDGFGHYLSHAIVQLYTRTPEKTTNCVSIAVTFATENKEKLVSEFATRLRETTLSDETAMAVWDKVLIPDELKKYAENAKSRVVQIDEAMKVAEKLNIQVVEITGKRGVIGAIASLGFADDPDGAVMVYA